MSDCLLKLQGYQEEQTYNAKKAIPESLSFIPAVPRSNGKSSEQHRSNYWKPECRNFHVSTLHARFQ